MKILLFLGSGVSLSSGLPSVGQITWSVLHDEWVQHTDERFYPGGSVSGRLDVQKFLALLLPHAERSHTMTGGEANYEDLFFLAEQIAEDARGWADNPAIHPFVSDLKKQTQSLTTKTLGKIADMTCNFIRRVVVHRLAYDGKVCGLDLVESLARAESVERLDIVTLNHDILVERFLDAIGIAFVDGFESPIGDVRYFKPNLFETTTKVRLFKLHGSINWYRFREETENPFSDRYGIPVHGSADLCKDDEGHFLDNVDVLPWILAGTNSKAAQYSIGIYSEMHYWFHKLLDEHGTIAMSGYGWSDRGINGRLIQWLHSPEVRRLVLMHEKPDELASFSKSSLWSRYDPLVQAGRIIPLRKWMQDVSIEEFFGRLNAVAPASNIMLQQ